MRVLHLTDQGFARREAAMLRRIEIGLADEGVSVFRAGPLEEAEDSAPELYRRSLGFPKASPWTTRRWRSRWLLNRLEEVAPVADGPLVDVIHAFGGGVWDLAFEVARQAQRPLVLEVWRARLAHRAGSLGASRFSAPLLLSTPDERIEAELSGAGLNVPVRLAPWGVHAPAREPARSRAPDRAPSVVIVGSGRDAHAMRACVRGLGLTVKRWPNLLIFVDASTVQRAKLWPLFEECGLLGNVTLVDELEFHRDLALKADAIALPEALGEQRTLPLDAMAAGVSVMAAPDPFVSWLIDARTAVLVHRPEPTAWGETASAVLAGGEAASEIQRSAWAYLRERRLASRHVASVMDVYEWVAADGGLKLDPTNAP